MLYRRLFAVLALTASTAMLMISGLEVYEYAAIRQSREFVSWGQLEHAHEVVRQAISVVPNSPHLRAEHGNILLAIWKWRGMPAAAEEAVLEFALAAAYNSSDGLAWGEYGEALRRTGRPLEAIAALQRGLQHDPHNTYLLGLLGQAQLESGMPAQAAATLDRALFLNPSSALSQLKERALLELSQTEEEDN